MVYILFDFDSTVVTQESLDDVIDLTLESHPQKEQLMQEVEFVTNQSMEGNMPFQESVRTRLGICSPPRENFVSIGRNLLQQITVGIPDLIAELQKQQHVVGIVSGGFLPCITNVAEALNLSKENLYSNEPFFDSNGNLTGINEESLLWTNEGKAPLIRHLKTTIKEPLILIGDGANDLRAFQEGVVNYFIGFGQNVLRKTVKDSSPYFAHDVHELKGILTKLLSTF